MFEYCKTYNHYDCTKQHRYYRLTWEGRELVEYKEYKNGTIYQIITYKYNDSGYRTYKKIESEGNIKEHFYYLEGSKVKCEEINDNGTIYKIFYTYDIDGSLISFKLNTEEYFYIRNLQGDIVSCKIVNDMRLKE